MPSSGRLGVGRVGADALVCAAGRQPGWLLPAAHPNKQICKAVIHFLPGQTIRKDDPQEQLPGENAKSGASLRWADGASAPTHFVSAPARPRARPCLSCAAGACGRGDERALLLCPADVLLIWPPTRKPSPAIPLQAAHDRVQDGTPSPSRKRTRYRA